MWAMLTVCSFQQDTLKYLLDGLFGGFEGFLDSRRDGLWSVFLARKFVLYRAPIVQCFDGVYESRKVVVCLAFTLQYLQLPGLVSR